MSPRTLDFPENLYLVLGIEPDVSDEQVRRAIRLRQRETHPDLGGDAAEFTRVRLAAEILGDVHRRADHDAWLATTQGIATPVRRTGVRLRKQQHAPRTRVATTPAAPMGAPGSTEAASRSAAGHTTAGSDLPAFERLPKPRVDARRMGWYRRRWPSTATSWPGRRPAVPGPSGVELATVLPFGVLAVVGVLLLVVPSSPFTSAGWPVALSAVAVAIVALVLRALGLRSRGSLVLVWLSVALAALGAALGFVEAMTELFAVPQGDLRPGIGHGVMGLAAVGLVLLAWRGLGGRNRRMELERLLASIADESAPAVDDPRRVWGIPGERVGYGRADVNPIRAQYAARIVGDTLAALERIPAVRIVHGLHAPGADEGVATISHAVVSGRRVALIGDELWRPGTYAIDSRGRVQRDGAPAPSGANEFPDRVERCTEAFGDIAEVRGWLVVAPDREGEVVIDNARTWRRVRLATVESMLREMGEWLAEDGVRVDRLLLRDVIALRVD